ncbi:acyl carrier protein [Streptomyces sp. PTM05]|uniref:Acyl carrier protein n=1 Tax=Streptantibioticus parmotrematis TaxID=2873249 RepID=A0ABS7R1G1_9ACTN|nr:acyl carrier protein [Streptantibioticus parmotrematis]MBY8889300.1 acyl carrier protein [Streptantibioticus parmotrematis]
MPGTVTAVLTAISGQPVQNCARRSAVLALDLGVDSLALLEVVEALQERLRIVVPDEVTARLRTVADLQDAAVHLAAAARLDATGKAPSSP